MKVDVLAGVLSELLNTPFGSIPVGGLNPATGSIIPSGFAVPIPGTTVILRGKEIPTPFLRAFISEIALPSWNPRDGGTRNHTDFPSPESNTGYQLNVDKDSAVCWQRTSSGLLAVYAAKVYELKDLARDAALKQKANGLGVLNLWTGMALRPVDLGDYRMPEFVL